jgi:hypothetical protein
MELAGVKDAIPTLPPLHETDHREVFDELLILRDGALQLAVGVREPDQDVRMV